jgi:hypothetical protein
MDVHNLLNFLSKVWKAFSWVAKEPKGRKHIKIIWLGFHVMTKVLFEIFVRKVVTYHHSFKKVQE